VYNLSELRSGWLELNLVLSTGEEPVDDAEPRRVILGPLDDVGELGNNMVYCTVIDQLSWI